jgi:hypothetical protein
MRLKQTDREFFRKLLCKKSTILGNVQVVDHFVREGIARQTLHNALNRLNQYYVAYTSALLHPEHLL